MPTQHELALVLQRVTALSHRRHWLQKNGRLRLSAKILASAAELNHENPNGCLPSTEG